MRSNTVIEVCDRHRIQCYNLYNTAHQKVNYINVIFLALSLLVLVEIEIQWYLQRSSRGYALTNFECGGYLGINDPQNGSQLEKVCEHNARIWTMEHSFDNVYT